ncbi:hypothetical protein WN55_09117 [Dufourea novaeangliae]|uniref:Uncharacterized protein n=1 Tax=Dufourea novaeangliae TaxID=178035 RepID=A0A154P9I1_DUFNO|nr:hypothetical protein WN55_09117 [Dufourea novaeangliae]
MLSRLILIDTVLLRSQLYLLNNRTNRNSSFSSQYVLILFDILEGENLKSNIRRAASGLMPYPRIGRNSEMAAGFSRSDRAAGLVNYPRVGRSDLSSSNINFNRLHDMDNDVDLQFYNVRDFDLDSAIDQDYEGERISVSISFEYLYNTTRRINSECKGGFKWLKTFHET